MALATENPKPVQKLNPAVPPALAELVMQLLAKDPARRPASAQVVAEALAAWEDDQTQIREHRPPTKPRPSGSGKRLGSLAAAALLLPIRLLLSPAAPGCSSRVRPASCCWG